MILEEIHQNIADKIRSNFGLFIQIEIQLFSIISYHCDFRNHKSIIHPYEEERKTMALHNWYEE